MAPGVFIDLCSSPEPDPRATSTNKPSLATTTSTKKKIEWYDLEAEEDIEGIPVPAAKPTAQAKLRTKPLDPVLAPAVKVPTMAKPANKLLDPKNDWVGGVGLSSSPLPPVATLQAAVKDVEWPKKAAQNLTAKRTAGDESEDDFDWDFYTSVEDKRIDTGEGIIEGRVGSTFQFSSPELPRKGKEAEGRVSDAAKAARNHWANTSLGSDIASSAPAKEDAKAIGKEDIKGGKEFYYLENDFDTTIIEDDPFASSAPPSKRRRLSVSPKLKVKQTGYQRAISNIESSSNAGPSRISAGPPMKRSSALDLDPLVFTSSPDILGDAARKRQEKRRKPSFSDSSELEEIENLVAKKKAKGKEKETTSKKKSKKDNKDDVDGSSSETDFAVWTARNMAARESKAVKSKGSKAPKSSAEAVLAKYEAAKAKDKEETEKKAKAKEKAEKSKGKNAEKEAEKECKAREKAEKAQEKLRAADLARVNLLKTDKKKSQEEMIVDLPSCLDEKLAERVHNFLDADEVKIPRAKWESRLPVIKWRRKVVAEFDTEQDLWVPLDRQRIDEEKHIMCIMTASEFVELVRAEEGRDLHCHVLNLKAKFEDREIIYLIEGMTPWFRKNRLIKDRAFKEAVRGVGQDNAPQTATQRKKKMEAFVPEDGIEEALMQLQVVHEVFIHHTGVPQETAEWILTFTQHISTIPYKKQKSSLDTAFCMESGQVKTGEDAKDTYIKMLQEMHRLTASVAHGIAAEYPTVQELVKGLKEKGPLALENCWKSANKDGAFTERRVGPAISRRVHKVFLGRDPGSWDV